jgi:ATP-binding cassette subfamily C (CFTR/MRP) protein 1
MTITRGALVSIVFSKVLTVSALVAATKGSNTLTLITNDVENIGTFTFDVVMRKLLTCIFSTGKGFQLLDDIWASPIEVGIALWLLYRELGIAFILPGIIAAGSYFPPFPRM